MPAFVRRPVTAVAEKYPRTRQPGHLAGLLRDRQSEYDYDPFWQRCLDLGFAVASHSSGMGFIDRASISNYMYNHIGHFAAAGEVLCKSLLMGGVTTRFPELARRPCSKAASPTAPASTPTSSPAGRSADLSSSTTSIRPASTSNSPRISSTRYGGELTEGRLDNLPRTLGMTAPDIEERLRDNFSEMNIERAEDFYDRFVPSFYFGCEADDPITAWAFDDKVNPFGAKIRAFMSTDLGHWDVPDMSEAVAEAYEPVENGLISPRGLPRLRLHQPAPPLRHTQTETSSKEPSSKTPPPKP